MARSLAATTRDADLRPLSAGGQPVAAAWAQISAHLARRLSPAHAAILAEPNPDPARATTDWYAEGEGEALPLDQAAPERAPAFEALATAIRAEAERLSGERDDGLRLLGELIALALELPDRSYIRVRGDAVFLVGWGHHLPGRAEGATLVRSLPNTATPMAMLAIGATPRRPIWAWALLAAALVVLMLALGAFLAWRDPFGWLVTSDAQCIVDPADLALLRDLDAAQAEEAILRDRLAGIAEELGRRRLACQPPPAPPPRPRLPEPPQAPPPTPPPAPEPPRNDDADRARREGAQEGRVQIILGWDTRDDLDLSVLCPDGQVLSYQRRQGCGGTLDVDRNVGGDRSRTPVENIFFTDPQPGAYQVRVHQFDSVDRPTTPYRVTIRIAGQPDRTIEGVARPGPPRVVDRFTIPGR